MKLEDLKVGDGVEIVRKDGFVTKALITEVSKCAGGRITILRVANNGETYLDDYSQGDLEHGYCDIYKLEPGAEVTP